MLFPYRGITPTIHSSVFLAPGAMIIGDVTIEADASIWFNAVVRGDVHFIKIGSKSNVQDGSVLHVTHDTHPLLIGAEVTIGHGVVLHGCTLHDRVLVGMNATILDGAEIESDSIIAAGSLIPEGKKIPSGSLVMGVPGKVIRTLTDAERAHLRQSAENYLNYTRNYKGLYPFIHA